MFWTLLSKEWRSAWSSLPAWLILSLLTLYFGFFFQATCLQGMTADMSDAYGNLAVALLITGPVLTMRAFADERRQGTLEILYTSPAPSSLLVLAKFVSILTVWVIFLGLTGIHALFLSAHAPFAWKAWVLLNTGSLLLGASVFAVGLFASALTDNQLVAALLALTFTMALFGLQWVAPAFSGWPRVLLEEISLTGQLVPFLKGFLDLKAVFFYAGVTAIFLFMTQKVLDGRRWTP